MLALPGAKKEKLPAVPETLIEDVITAGEAGALGVATTRAAHHTAAAAPATTITARCPRIGSPQYVLAGPALPRPIWRLCRAITLARQEWPGRRNGGINGRTAHRAGAVTYRAPEPGEGVPGGRPGGAHGERQGDDLGRRVSGCQACA